MKLGNVFHHLSLDVVAGACVCSIFISHILNKTLSFPAVVCLGLTVWVIYSFDHFMDAQKLRIPGKPRHQFYRDNSKVMKFVIPTAVAINGIFILFLPKTILIFGIALLILVAAYFMVIRLASRYVGFFKEFLVAIIYSAGLFAPSVSSLDLINEPAMILLYLLFFLLSWTNLLLFSWFDNDYDKKAGFVSITSVLGKQGTRNLIGTLVLLFFGIWIVIFNSSVSLLLPGEVKWITMVMGCILALIILRPGLFIVAERYRLLGDAIFLLPLAAILT